MPYAFIYHHWINAIYAKFLSSNGFLGEPNLVDSPAEKLYTVLETSAIQKSSLSFCSSWFCQLLNPCWPIPVRGIKSNGFSALRSQLLLPQHTLLRIQRQLGFVYPSKSQYSQYRIRRIPGTMENSDLYPLTINPAQGCVSVAVSHKFDFSTQALDLVDH